MKNKRLDFDEEPLGALEDEDDPWQVKEEAPKRLPPKSDDFARRPKHVHRRQRRVTNEVTLSLHVYGKHINFTGRSQFDPETNTETPFSVKQEPHRSAHTLP